MQYKEQNCLLQNTVVARMRRISIGHLIKPTYLQVFGFFRIRSNRNEKQQGEDSRHHGCVLAQDPVKKGKNYAAVAILQRPRTADMLYMAKLIKIPSLQKEK